MWLSHCLLLLLAFDGGIRLVDDPLFEDVADVVGVTGDFDCSWCSLCLSDGDFGATSSAATTSVELLGPLTTVCIESSFSFALSLLRLLLLWL